MAKLRKYLVFWIIVLGAFIPFAAPVGTWMRTTVAPRPAAAAGPALDSDSVNSVDDGVAGPDEELALSIESDFEMVDVVNIAHVGDGAGGIAFVMQMGIDRPVEDAVYEAILVKALQGLETLKSGDENYYWVELMYGNWLVGRLECSAQPYAAADISSDNCEFNDVNPPAYLGDMIRWPGRPADSETVSQ
jgi:hypothetical protein